MREDVGEQTRPGTSRQARIRPRARASPSRQGLGWFDCSPLDSTMLPATWPQPAQRREPLVGSLMPASSPQAGHGSSSSGANHRCRSKSELAIGAGVRPYRGSQLCKRAMGRTAHLVLMSNSAVTGGLTHLLAAIGRHGWDFALAPSKEAQSPLGLADGCELSEDQEEN